MITLRSMAGAILANNNDLLLMKRSEQKEFYPGIWAFAGGHLEPGEINDPQTACMREVYEETGLSAQDIDNLALRYIVLRRSKDEIRISYVFFADALKREITECNEGELHWIKREEALSRPMSAFTRLVLRRYLEHGDEKEVLVGTLSGSEQMDWMPLAGWEGL